MMTITRRTIYNPIYTPVLLFVSKPTLDPHLIRDVIGDLHAMLVHVILLAGEDFVRHVELLLVRNAQRVVQVVQRGVVVVEMRHGRHALLVLLDHSQLRRHRGLRRLPGADRRC